MDDDLFNSLAQSLKEAAAISKGQTTPSRITTLVSGPAKMTTSAKPAKPTDDVPPTQTISSAISKIDAKTVREQIGLSQSDFAVIMNVSVKTLQCWERQQREPTGAALALLKIVASEPEIALRALQR